MQLRRFKTILIGFTIFLALTLVIASSVTAFNYADLRDDMKQQLAAKSFLQPTEYYSHQWILKPEMNVSVEILTHELKNMGFRERSENQQILERDFIILSPDGCLKELGQATDDLPKESTGLLQSFFLQQKNTPIGNCILMRTPANPFATPLLAWIIFDESNQNILRIFGGEKDPESFDRLSLGVELVAQYLGNEPIMQEVVDLGQIPLYCLRGVLSIEDKGFYEHQGFSFWNIFRASAASALRILQGGRAQGGSTITQQLVKNYFLSHERTLKRKYQEILLSVAIEKELTKDEILNLYLNIIYMGQNGPFQVRGFGAAAKFYFQTPVQDLNLEQCAFLAAVLNGPGVYNPFSKNEKAKNRRNLVLGKMAELNHISEVEKLAAQAEPLVVQKNQEPFETAPYFLEAVREQLTKSGIELQNKKILTTLSMSEQKFAQDAMSLTLQNFETQNKKIKKIKESGKSLEAVVIASDLDGRITSFIGGRSFRATQFNRGLKAHRQVGSLFKPLVYLTALESGAYSPTSDLIDEPLTVTQGNQKWTPANYDKKFSGNVPLYLALQNSLNIPPVRLTLELGVDKVIDLSRRFQIESKLISVPSLALGSFELYPYEILRTYIGFANFGRVPHLTWIDQARDSQGEIIYEFHPEYVEASSAPATATLVSMMTLVPQRGTARSISGANFPWSVAGKTGTTNDYKDSWFLGFTPTKAGLVWVGYDDNTVSGLTGASGAVPIWVPFMKQTLLYESKKDFPWPEEFTEKTIQEGSETISIKY